MSSVCSIVIIGGGIAGITCLETLMEAHDLSTPSYDSITLISESRLVKRVVNYEKRGINLEKFDIKVDDASAFWHHSLPKNLSFRFVAGRVSQINCKDRVIDISSAEPHNSNIRVSYDILCLCHGSSPRSLNLPGGTSKEILDHILTLRDTSSIKELERRLAAVKKIAIVGNGGISLELAYRLIDCDRSWIVRDEYIGRPFLDSGASKFILESLDRDCESTALESSQSYHYDAQMDEKHTMSGPALGPYWSRSLNLPARSRQKRKLDIYYRSEVRDVSAGLPGCHALRVSLNDNRTVDCDLIVAAIGVQPNVIKFTSGSPETSAEGGILVDEEMRTSIRELYAAGDVASCERWPQENLWFQMPLWTQARQMGQYCARCIAAHLTHENPAIFANFECFTHVTSFFGHKLILLGRYNDQHLANIANHELEVIARINSGKDYVKLILRDNKVIGAILIGDTNLEETIENLIHDQVNVRDIKNHLLDDTIDIEDYFD